MMEATYPSKRDGWLTALVIASAVSTALAGAAVWTQPGNLTQKAVVSGICALVALFTVDLLVRTRYTLGPETLRVRCGVLHWHVPYSAIVSVRPSRTLVSGPALSLDRLLITRSDSRLPLIISPIDQRYFLEDLASRATGLTLVGGTVCRSAG